MSKMKNDMFKIKAQKVMRRASLQYLNRHLFLCQNHNLYFPKYKTGFKKKQKQTKGQKILLWNWNDTRYIFHVSSKHTKEKEIHKSKAVCAYFRNHCERESVCVCTRVCQGWSAPWTQKMSYIAHILKFPECSNQKKKKKETVFERKTKNTKNCWFEF